MGGSYNAPSPQSEASILKAYQQYLPGVLGATATEMTPLAQAQYDATAATQPQYNALNLDQVQKYGQPLAEAGQQITQSELTGTGGQSAQDALALARSTNPNYYSVQDPASSQAAKLLGSIDLTGLSPGEINATERSLNQNNVGTGNLGLMNPSNTVKNAMDFGGAYNNKLGLLGSALGTATGVATSAQNTGFNPINIALGQANTAPMSNFGAGTFSPANAGTQSGAASGALGFGSSMLSGANSANNAMTSGAYGLAQANAIPNYIPSLSC